MKQCNASIREFKTLDLTLEPPVKNLELVSSIL